MPTDYTFMDATLEILLMLLAAFLLGWLFCWILKKLFGKSTSKTNETELSGVAASSATPDLNEQASQTVERSGLSASSRERFYDPEHGLTKDSIDSTIPTVETVEVATKDIDTDLDSTSRPRIDIPDLNLPETDIKEKLSDSVESGKDNIKTGLGAAAVGLGGIAAGVGALKDKTVDNASNIEFPDTDIKGKLDAGLDLGKDSLSKSVDTASNSLDNITESVSTLKDKAVDSVSEIDLPDVDLKAKLDAGLDAGKNGLSTSIDAVGAGLGGIADGASDLKDKAIDNIPNIDLPDTNLKEKLDAGLELGKSGLDNITDGAGKLKDKVVDSIAEVDLPAPDLKGKLDAGIELGKIGLDKGLETANSGLSSITDGAKSLKDKAVESITEVDLPEIDAKEKLEASVEAGKSGLGKGLGIAATGLGAIAAGASTLKDKAIDGVTSGTDSLANSASSVKETVADSINSDKDELADASLTPPDLPQIDTISEREVKTDLGNTTTDLTRISGIDENVAELLAIKGIKSFSDLQNTDSNTLKNYLVSAGSNAEPASWPHQAKLCASQNWSKLAEYQAFLSGTATPSATPSVEEATLGKDDLKKIEGIGPFFESLLNKAGITTYAQLKNSDRDTLKEIIDAAGPDYRLHEPETWPYQAGLADRGEWKKLQDYIHFMTGRS